MRLYILILITLGSRSMSFAQKCSFEQTLSLAPCAHAAEELCNKVKASHILTASKDVWINYRTSTEAQAIKGTCMREKRNESLCSREVYLKYKKEKFEYIQNDPNFKQASSIISDMLEQSKKDFIESIDQPWIHDNSESPLLNILSYVDVNPYQKEDRDLLKRNLGRIEFANSQDQDLEASDAEKLLTNRGTASFNPKDRNVNYPPQFENKRSRDVVTMGIDIQMELAKPEYQLLLAQIIYHETAHLITRAAFVDTNTYYRASAKTSQVLEEFVNGCQLDPNKSKRPAGKMQEDLADFLAARLVSKLPQNYYSQDKIETLASYYCSMSNEESLAGHEGGQARLHKVILQNKTFRQKLNCEAELKCEPFL